MDRLTCLRTISPLCPTVTGNSAGLSATRGGRELPLLVQYPPGQQCPWNRVLKGRWRPQFLAVLAAVPLLLQA